MHSTHVHRQNCTRQNVCKQNELLRLQNSCSSELILLAHVHQRWVVKEVWFSCITEDLCCYTVAFQSLLKPCQQCAAATPETQLCNLSPLPVGSHPGLAEWGPHQTGAAAPRCPETHRQQLTGKVTDMKTRLLRDRETRLQQEGHVLNCEESRTTRTLRVAVGGIRPQKQNCAGTVDL